MKPRFDSTRIAEAMIEETKKPIAVGSADERKLAARRNIQETLKLLDRHEVRAIPARREEATAGNCFKRVRRILDGRDAPN